MTDGVKRERAGDDEDEDEEERPNKPGNKTPVGEQLCRYCKTYHALRPSWLKTRGLSGYVRDICPLDLHTVGQLDATSKTVTIGRITGPHPFLGYLERLARDRRRFVGQ